MSHIFFPQMDSIFHLASEFERASRSAQCAPRQQTRSFAPRFDVKETKEAYELLGELPGLDRSNVSIEWAEDNTLTISGSTESSYDSAPSSPATPTSDAGEEPEVIDADEASGYQKPSVEDEAADGKKTTTVTKAEGKSKAVEETKPRYWVSERSVGSFSRSFKFPIRVDYDNVMAGLKNGILNITIPKAKPVEPRKITIQ